MNSLVATALAVVAIIALSLLTQTQSLTVHLVCHTHDDVGWLKTVDQYYMGANNSVQHASVQYILDSVVLALSQNSERKFSYVEQAFFQRWWRQQTTEKQALVKSFVANKQLEFINGGWCMHDEAAAHYVDMIDQTTLGHKFIFDEFGVQPTIGWQIDPFGHSATQAALLSAEVGFDALFFARIDYQDSTRRLADKDLEFIWRASESLGPTAQVFTGVFPGNNLYGPPDGFCFDWFCTDSPIQDNINLEDPNLQSRVDDFVSAAINQAAGTRGDNRTMNIMWTLGSDFMHENSNQWFKNLDKLIKYVNADGRVKVRYSTPSEYVQAKNAEPVQWTVKTDDFFPYADSSTSYWTGYFTSRPALKRYVRVNSALLQVARHFEVFFEANATTETLWEAQGVAQHHDAVSGTSKQHVAYDYALRLSNGAAVAADIIHTALAHFTNASSDATFSYCPLLNVSVCPSTQAENKRVIVAYNPQARVRYVTIRLPINTPDAIIVDTSGNELLSQIDQNAITSATTSNSALFSLIFQVQLPPLGFDTFILTSTSRQPTKHQMTLKAAAPVNVIGNAYWTLTFDPATGLLQSVTNRTSNITFPFTNDFAYYTSFQAVKPFADNCVGNDSQSDGAYIFLPENNFAVPLSQAKLTLYTGAIIAEARQVFGDWLQQTIRLVGDSPRIEFEWTVGAVPIDDGIGKNIVIRFNTTMKSAATWFTDSNGREFQKRIRDFRPSWKLLPVQPIAGNYYPVNTAAYLTDGTSALVVNNDRSQGAASIVDGELEFMIHRRLLVDDCRGVNEPLNETAAITGADGIRIGTGLVITGTHYVHLTSAGEAARAARITQDEVFQPPHIAFAPLTSEPEDYATTHTTLYAFTNNSLPRNVELMTVQQWNAANQFLVRLSHQFGHGEDYEYSAPVDVDLDSLFPALHGDYTISELSLTANQPVDAHQRLVWNTTTDSGSPRRKDVRTLKDNTITLSPLQIRTFVFQLN